MAEEEDADWVTLGVVVWSEDPEVPPLLVAGRGRAEVTRRLAMEIDETIRDPNAFVGAADFLAGRDPLTEDTSGEHVQRWLAEFSGSSSYPRWSVTETSLSFGPAFLNTFTRDLSRFDVLMPAHPRPGLDSPPSAENNNASELPQVPRTTTRPLLIGVIHWGDALGHEPRIMGSVDSSMVTFAMAMAIHEELANYPDIYRAREFLHSHTAPKDWQHVREAEEWLADVDRELESPKFYYHQIRISGSSIHSDDPSIQVELFNRPEWITTVSARRPEEAIVATAASAGEAPDQANPDQHILEVEPDLGESRWGELGEGPIPDYLSAVFPAPPSVDAFRRADGTIDGEEFGNATDEWCQACMGLADEMIRAPETLARLEHATQILSGITELVHRSGPSKEPDRVDYPGPADTGYEPGAFERAHDRWMHDQATQATILLEELRALLAQPEPQSQHEIGDSFRSIVDQRAQHLEPYPRRREPPQHGSPQAWMI